MRTQNQKVQRYLKISTNNNHLFSNSPWPEQIIVTNNHIDPFMIMSLLQNAHLQSQLSAFRKFCRFWIWKSTIFGYVGLKWIEVRREQTTVKINSWPVWGVACTNRGPKKLPPIPICTKIRTLYSDTNSPNTNNNVAQGVNWVPNNKKEYWNKNAVALEKICCKDMNWYPVKVSANAATQDETGPGYWLYI